MFVLRTNHTFVLRINLVVLRITTRGVLSVIFDSLQVSIDPRHARCPNLNPFDPGRFPYFPHDNAHTPVGVRNSRTQHIAVGAPRDQMSTAASAWTLALLAGAGRGRMQASVSPLQIPPLSALHCRNPDLGLIRPWRIRSRFGPRVDQTASQRLLSSLSRDYFRSA